MTTFNITVTQEDIQDGERGIPWACPLAKAAKRAGLDAPIVGYTTNLEGCINGKRMFCILSPAAESFIDSFDEQREVYPFSFVATFQPSLFL